MNRKGFTSTEFLVVLSLFLILPAFWITNIVRLCKCDFASPYKGEIIHAVGVIIPPAAVVTVWFNDK